MYFKFIIKPPTEGGGHRAEGKREKKRMKGKLWIEKCVETMKNANTSNISLQGFGSSLGAFSSRKSQNKWEDFPRLIQKKLAEILELNSLRGHTGEE